MAIIGAFGRARHIFYVALSVALCTTGARSQTETHGNLQKVTTTGTSAWEGEMPFTLRGIILNNPEEMLEGAWDVQAETLDRMGAQWQIFIQSADPADRGGTACWMGQNYNSLGAWIPGGNAYSEAAWSNEMQRLNYDAATGRLFRQGDLVEVTARKSIFFGGKQNINEAHRTIAANDFDISLITAGYGRPEPELITLAKLVEVDDGNPGTHEDIFDQTRQSGGEYYQGMLVRIEPIRLATNYYGQTGWDADEWSERRCTVTDGQGRFFTLRMPLSDLGTPPSDWFSAVGILNQESGSGSDGTYGYELFVQEIGPRLSIVSSEGRDFVYWSGFFTNYVLEYAESPGNTSEWKRVGAEPVKWMSLEHNPSELDAEIPVYRLRRE